MNWNARFHNEARAALAAIALILFTGFTPFTAAQNAPPARKVEAKKPDYSPYPDQKFPNRVFWGVAHVHTGYSFDSGMFGVTLTPDDLFRVAAGGEVVIDNGQRFKQDRPLDWVSITDHAEYMGISDQIRAGSPELPRQPTGQALVRDVQDEPAGGCQSRHRSGRLHADRQACLRRQQAHGRGLGARHAAAEKWNQPGVFTTLHGFEWTLRTRRQQPSSHRHLPRRRGPREPGRSLFHLRQPGSGGPVEVHGRVREEDRRPGARHPAQRQPEQRA